MEEKKRQRQNNIIDNNNKRKKLIFDSEKYSFTHFEDLSNELLYEIFDYLDFYYIHQAFSNLNVRFQNLLNDPILPIRINLSVVSKSIFQNYYTHIIIPYQHRITLFHLSHPSIIDHIFSPISILSKFIRLENLSLYNIESKYFEELLIYLIDLPRLSSLDIKCTDYTENKNIIYHKIFQLPVLKYCKLLLEGNIVSYPLLPNETIKYSSIEYLIINSKIYLDELNTILLYIPKIRRLSVRNLYKNSKNQITELNPIELNYLTHISLTMTNVSFDQFELIIKNFFHQIQILYISIEDDLIYIDANRWQELIVSHLPNLQIFNIQYQHSFNKINQLSYDILLKKFNSIFWFEHKWFFEHKIYHYQNDDHFIFYSINPYRRKQYILCDERKVNEIDQINSVNQLKIRTKKTIINCKNYFPNVTQLTLFHDFIHESKRSFANQFSQIIPLKQLTKLIIYSNLSCFLKIIELLHYTPNIYTFNIELLSSDERQRVYQLTNLYVLQQSKTFQTLSKTNNIRNVTIKSCYTMELMPFFMNLCPKLQYLTINGLSCSFERLLQILFTQTSVNNSHLASFCIEDVFETSGDVVKQLIKSWKDINADVTKVRGLLWNNIYTH